MVRQPKKVNIRMMVPESCTRDSSSNPDVNLEDSDRDNAMHHLQNYQHHQQHQQQQQQQQPPKQLHRHHHSYPAMQMGPATSVAEIDSLVDLVPLEVSHNKSQRPQSSQASNSFSSDTFNNPLHAQIRNMFWLAFRIWPTLYQKKSYQTGVLTLTFAGMLTAAAVQRGFVYTPTEDVVVYCFVYSLWITTCLPWLLLNLDGKRTLLIFGVLFRLFAADIGILGYASFRGDTHILERGLRLKPVMETSLSWLSEAGYSLRFAVVAASIIASLSKYVVDKVESYYTPSPSPRPSPPPTTTTMKKGRPGENETRDEHKHKEYKCKGQGDRQCAPELKPNSKQLDQDRVVEPIPNAIICSNNIQKTDEVGFDQMHTTIIKPKQPKRKCPMTRRIPAEEPAMHCHSEAKFFGPRKSENCKETQNPIIADTTSFHSRTSIPRHRKPASQYNGPANTTNYPTKYSSSMTGNRRNFSEISPGKPKEGASSYSRLNKEKKGGHEDNVDLKPWKKTNPTIFAPAKPWQARDDLLPDRHNRMGKMGENMSFNKSVADYDEDCSEAQSLMCGIILSVRENKYTEEEIWEDGGKKMEGESSLGGEREGGITGDLAWGREGVSDEGELWRELEEEKEIWGDGVLVVGRGGQREWEGKGFGEEVRRERGKCWKGREGRGLEEIETDWGEGDMERKGICGANGVEEWRRELKRETGIRPWGGSRWGGAGSGGGRGNGLANDALNRETTDTRNGSPCRREQHAGSNGSAGGYFQRELMKRKLATKRKTGKPRVK